MKIIIVGGGAAGLVASLAIKKNKPNYDVLVIDKNEKLGKKLRATGNGKCNICNIGSIKGKYLCEYRATKLFDEINPPYLINFFHKNNIQTIAYGDYVYPYSESATMLTETLINNAKKLGVNFISEETAIDYKDNVLVTNKGKYEFDKLVISTGLGSSPQLGGDSSFVKNLITHGYHIYDIKPGLLPIKTMESTKEVNGIRRKVNVRLVSKNKVYMDEDGELLFKKDGLSGIVIYHAASTYLRNNLNNNAEILIDFIPHEKFNGNYNEYFVSELAKYLKSKGDPKKVIFHVKDFYSANESVASIGGVSLSDIDDDFKSKIESNVYIIGEALNQDGLCGGYNLMWAFTSALKVSKVI